jgi:branched-chain amino acid transport system substrate-binding protein
MLKGKLWRALLAGGLAAAALAGCGSSSDSSSKDGVTPAAASTTGAKAATGTPIVIGTICSCSGPFASSVGSQPKVVEAWTKYINANGGINGHPVEVKLEDDGGDASKSQRLIRKLVEQDHIMALVAEQTPAFDSLWADYITKKGVPVVGGTPFTPPMMSNPNFFPAGGNYPSMVWGLANVTKQAGKSKIAVLACAESPFCANYAKQIAGVAAAVVPGVKVVYQTKIAATTTNFTSQCLAAKSAGADTMYVGHAGTVVQQVVGQCAKLGYKPLQIQAGGDVINAWSSDPNLEGVKALQFNLPLHDETAEGTKAFHAAVQQYTPDLEKASNYADNSLISWTGFQLFAAAAKAGKIEPGSTGEDVKAGLYALKDETLGGISPPLTFVKGQPTLINCYFNESIEGGEWTTPGGTKPVCMSPDIATKVHAAYATANK